MNFTKHMMNERLDRAGFILSHVSLGHSVAEQLIQEPGKKDCVRVLTNTGIILVYTANKEKEDALKLKAEYDAKVKNAEAEAEEILSEARRRALKNERAILEEAKEEAARIIANANVQIDLEKKKAMDDLKQEVVAIATMMAGKMVAVSMDEKTQNQLIEDTLKEMGDDTWQS